MEIGTLIYFLITLCAAIYMLGIGYKFLPDPGKKGSDKNKAYIDKYRGFIKFGGICMALHGLFLVLITLLD